MGGPLLQELRVPTFHPEETERRMAPILQKAGLKLRVLNPTRFNATDFPNSKLGVGENGYRKSMEAIMEQFLNETAGAAMSGETPQPLLFIADDDAHFHRDFVELYRCSCLTTTCQPSDTYTCAE
jgi:hypothetical protein